MRLFFGLTASAALVAVACRAPLSWDGGWILFALLDSQAPVLYADRFTSVPLHVLVLLVAQFTNDLLALEIAFSTIYAGVPVLSLALCWWLVRRSQPSLFIWPALGIGIGTLPGQLNFLSDSLLAIHLFWPFFLSLLCRFPKSHLPIAAVVFLAILLGHPVALLLFLFAAAVAGVIGWRWTDARRRMWASAGLLVVACVVKMALFVAFRTDYDSAEASLAAQRTHFQSALSGAPLLALGCAWLAAVSIFFWPRVTPARSRRFELALASAPLIAIAASGLLLATWATDPAQWSTALDFRNLALPCSLPFMFLAVAEATFPAGALDAEATTESRRRLPLLHAAAAVFLLVLSIQSTGWSIVSTRLRKDIADSSRACLSLTDLGWPVNTPLYHWATPAYSVLLQGRTAKVSVLFEGECSPLTFAQAVRWGHSGAVRPDGWFVLPQ